MKMCNSKFRWILPVLVAFVPFANAQNGGAVWQPISDTCGDENLIHAASYAADWFCREKLILAVPDFHCESIKFEVVRASGRQLETEDESTNYEGTIALTNDQGDCILGFGSNIAVPQKYPFDEDSRPEISDITVEKCENIGFTGKCIKNVEIMTIEEHVTAPEKSGSLKEKFEANQIQDVTSGQGQNEEDDDRASSESDEEVMEEIIKEDVQEEEEAIEEKEEALNLLGGQNTEEEASQTPAATKENNVSPPPPPPPPPPTASDAPSFATTPPSSNTPSFVAGTTEEEWAPSNFQHNTNDADTQQPNSASMSLGESSIDEVDIGDETPVQVDSSSPITQISEETESIDAMFPELPPKENLFPKATQAPSNVTSSNVIETAEDVTESLIQEEASPLLLAQDSIDNDSSEESDDKSQDESDPTDDDNENKSDDSIAESDEDDSDDVSEDESDDSIDKSVEVAASISSIPSDEDLAGIGWAKALDPAKQAYYYFPVDGSTGPIWENPFATLTATAPVIPSTEAPIDGIYQTVASPDTIDAAPNALEGGAGVVTATEQPDLPSGAETMEMLDTTEVPASSSIPAATETPIDMQANELEKEEEMAEELQADEAEWNFAGQIDQCSRFGISPAEGVVFVCDTAAYVCGFDASFRERFLLLIEDPIVDGCDIGKIDEIFSAPQDCNTFPINEHHLKRDGKQEEVDVVMCPNGSTLSSYCMFCSQELDNYYCDGETCETCEEVERRQRRFLRGH